jgi:CheY-like chemotaxis protein
MDKNLNILVVDDDHQSVLIIEKFLKKQGYKTTSVNSAINGSVFLKKEFFDLVITDLIMPQVNGLEFLLWINENSPRTKVIIVTGNESSNSEIKDFAEEKGVIKYLNKPIDLLELKSLITKTIDSNKSVRTSNYLGLLDFIRMLIVSMQQTLILVTDPTTDITGSIYVNNGSVIDAQYDDLKGEEAFFKMVTLKTGMFIDKPWIDPSINIPFSELLLHLNQKLLNDTLLKAQQGFNNPAQPEPEADKTETENENGVATEQSLTRFRHSARLTDQAIALKELRETTDPLKKLTIYECGVALGIIIGETKKSEVMNIMIDYSKKNNTANQYDRMLFYDDISLIILFDSDDTVEEMRFGVDYKGSTSKGIRINDMIDKAMKIYEPPKACTLKGAIWDNFAIFCAADRIITTIKITATKLL